MPSTIERIERRGGARRGAGRPSTGLPRKKAMGCAVCPDLFDFVNEIRGDATCSATIERLLLGCREFQDWKSQREREQ
mgnify:CR=1 FL=1